MQLYKKHGSESASVTGLKCTLYYKVELHIIGEGKEGVKTSV